MISAVFFDTHLEVKISGNSLNEFEIELAQVKATFDRSDRQWDDNRQVWIIKNVERYIHVPYVKAAMLSRQSQPTLF